MVSALKTALVYFVFFPLCLVKKSWQCKKPLPYKSKSVEVTGLRSDVSQFPNSDERSKMVLTDNLKAVIENDFNEKGWNACKIWKKHPSFECFRMAVNNLIKKIKEIGSTERRKRSGQSVTATTEENAKSSKIGFLMGVFRADIVQFFSAIVNIFILGSRLGTRL